MKTIRRLHLWIGLLTSVLILVEAVTGLLMVEPRLMGASAPAMEQRVEHAAEDMAERETAQAGEPSEGLESERHFSPPGRENSAMGFIKGLHSGRIGDTDVSFLLDITAIVLIILTTTGIILSVRELNQGRNRSRKITYGDN